ncbi:MAG TPA: PEGA domain-containing protein [Polyangiaceae bacterium]|nr:PEGA domain-containing protein [Polyangiaceae bacterium]
MTWLARLLVAAVLLLVASGAQAQDDAEAKGRELATEAMGHYKEGAYEQALEKFEAARKVYPSGQVLRLTGYTLMALGRWLQAADALEEALASKLKPLNADDAQHASDQLKKVMEHVAVVTVTSRVAGARVSIDEGAERPLPATVRVDPGNHNFVVSAAGHEDASATPELGAGERITLTLDPKRRPRRARPLPQPEPEPVEDEGGTFGWFPGQGVVGLVTAGVGLALGGVAIGTAIYGLTLRDAVQENIDAHNVEYDPQCRRYTELCRYDIELINRDGQRAADYQNVAMVTGIVGAALFASGLTLFLLSDDSPLAPEVSLACQLGVAGAACAGAF